MKLIIFSAITLIIFLMPFFFFRERDNTSSVNTAVIQIRDVVTINAIGVARIKDILTQGSPKQGYLLIPLAKRHAYKELFVPFEKSSILIKKLSE